MDKSEWKSLNFNPTQDGKWATVKEIQKRIGQNRKDEFKTKVFIFSIFAVSALFLSLLIWLLL
tara:strand:- start:6775 stop:6963 length:189 start_codon:yes stop_codon:yes gene_type:complete